MNCPQCGAELPQGAQVCPACGLPLQNAYQAYPQGAPMQQPAQNQPNAGYGQPAQNQPNAGYTQPAQNPMQQGYVPPQGYVPQSAQNPANQGFGYAPNDPNAQGYGFPQGYANYQQPFGHYQNGAQPREHGPFWNAMSNLPRVLGSLFRDPGEALQGMMERRDLYTGGVIAGATLILTFLCAMIVTRSMVSLLFSMLATLTGASLASSSAGLNQGVSYIAGRIAPQIGGVAALCQLFAMAFPTAVAMVYLCVLRKARFSFLFASNVLALTTLPTIAASLLCMLASLISPMAAGVVTLLGNAASYVILCTLMVRVTGEAPQQTVGAKIAVVCVSMLLTALFAAVVGGLLMTGVMRTLSGLMSSMSSLL